MFWGTFFKEEFSKFKWAFPVFGGSKRLPGWFGALIYRHNGDFTNFLKSVPEFLALGCLVECWGVQSLFEQYQHVLHFNDYGSSLRKRDLDNKKTTKKSKTMTNTLNE